MTEEEMAAFQKAAVAAQRELVKGEPFADLPPFSDANDARLARMEAELLAVRQRLFDLEKMIRSIRVVTASD
jgi:hypothetical protein